jgi:LysM repeat protein
MTETVKPKKSKKKKIKLKKPTPLGILAGGLKRGLSKTLSNQERKRFQKLVKDDPNAKLATDLDKKITMSRINKRKELRDEKKASKLGNVMSKKNKIAQEKAIVVGTKKPTPANIRKFAGLKGKAAAIKRYGKEAVDNVISIGSKKKIGTPPSSGGYGGGLGSHYPTGIPMTGKVGGAGGLRTRKSGGKIIAKNGGGKTVTETTKPKKIKLKKPTPLGILAGGLKKGLKRVITDIKPLTGRTWTGKRKVPKNPKRPVIARREDSIQLKSGKIITPEGGVKNYKLKPGEKKVSRVKGNVIPGKGRKRPGVGRLQKSASLKKVADIDKKVTQRNIRRFGTRALAIAAGAYTVKTIADAIKKPPMAATDTSSSGGSHTVKSGDTLSQIADRRGTTLKALLAANPSIKNANAIRVGQKIKMSKPVAKRKSVYQGMKKSEMKKIDMTKKKMGGGKVYRRGGGKALRGFGKATYSNKLY